MTDGDFIPWTVDEFVKECSWHGLDSSRLTDDYKEKAAQRECEDLINSFAGSPNIPKDDISRFYASVEYISYDNHYPYVEQYDVLRGWIDGYNTAKNREKPLSDKIKASEYKFDKDFYGLKKQEKAGKEYVSENRYTCIDDGDRYKEGFRAGYGGTIKEMYLARDEAVLGCNLAQEPEEPSKENASQESFEQLLSQSLAKELKEAKARIAELEAENKTPAKDNFKEKTMWNKSQPYDFGKDEIGQEALDNYFGDIPEDVADYAETEEANKTGFKDGYMAAMERMLGENQKLREQLEQVQQKVASLDALNYAIENHPDERLAESVSKNAAEMIKWANYTMEHGHVQGKDIEIEGLRLAANDDKGNIIYGHPLKSVAALLEDKYHILHKGSRMQPEPIGCEPTPEGIATYMKTVRELYDKTWSKDSNSPVIRECYDIIGKMIEKDFSGIQMTIDYADYKEKSAQMDQEQAKNIEKDVVQKDENNKDIGTAIGED